MRVAIYTLGCKVNQYETQAMEAELTGRGHALVPFDGAADAYVINTCTVTAVSDKKSRQMIRQARKRSPHAVVGVNSNIRTFFCLSISFTSSFNFLIFPCLILTFIPS